MINAEQITTRLRMMSDTDLQRFAEMHKQDPYMFPLAFNESNMRKKVRAAGAMQQQQPQRPVNEQAVQAMSPAMLPENQGIGALNPQMQFASGGLVAFAEGGSPEDEYEINDDAYAGEMPTYAGGGAVRYDDGGKVTAGKGLTPYAPYSLGKVKQAKETPETLEDIRTRQAVLEAGLPWIATAADIGTLPARAVRKVYDVGAGYANAFGAGLPREGEESARFRNEIFPNFNALKAQEMQASAETKASTAAAEAAAKAASASPPSPPPPGPPPPAAPPIAVPSVSPNQFSTAPGIKKLYADAAAKEEAVAGQRTAEYLKGRPEPETFAEQKALLQENAADAEKQQRMDEGLAWLTFASKVMTPGMNPIQALVEGVAAGTSQYAGAQKELKKAERERKMGLAALAQAERAAKRQDYDAVEQFKLKALESADRMRQSATTATASAMGVDAQTAMQINEGAMNRAASAANAQAQIAAQERIANLGLYRSERQTGAQAARDLEKEVRDVWTDPAKRAALPPNIKSIDDLRVYLTGMSGGAAGMGSLSGFGEPVKLSPPAQPPG